MVRNKVSTLLLFIGGAIWMCAILTISFNQTAYLVLTTAAMGVFFSAIVIGLFYKQLFPTTEA
jgi:hypothetical protein